MKTNDRSVFVGRMIQLGVFLVILFMVTKFYITMNFGHATIAIMWSVCLDFFITPIVDESVQRRRDGRG